MYASVIVDVPNKRVSKIFHYRIPESLSQIIKVGHRVLVPFGYRNVQGFVMGIEDEIDFEESKLKDISHTLDLEPVLTEELVSLCMNIADYYIDNYINVIEAVLPAALKANYKKFLRAVDDDEAQQIIDEVVGNKEVKQLTAEDFKKLKPYIKDEKIYEETVIQQHTKKLMKLAVYAVVDNPYFERARRQEELFYKVKDANEPLLVQHLIQEGYNRTLIDTLCKKGYLEKTEVEIERDPYKNVVFESDSKKVLTDKQQSAYDSIKDSIKGSADDVFLLHGITGSGKTEVYMQAIQSALDRGEEAIMLVPEIALTPQTVNRFKRRFGDDVAVLHSGLSHGEKYDEWRKIRSGRAKVSVGARSNIFAPFQNLGIIIIDEEHESTYKQVDRPMYHAIEVAKVRAKHHKCPIVLGSATPSMESYARATNGVYKLLKLTERATQQKLPNIKIIDMAHEHKDGNHTILSNELKETIEDRIEKGEQTVLLLNRRGYSNFQLCQDCGHVPVCPNCDISLTYHKSTHQLICHYCSFERAVVTRCESCDSDAVSFRGIGTEQVEELLRDTFNTEVIRMDFDTTKRKGMHETLLKKFEEEKVPILLGTQMIAKGLDYPNITLVGVLNSDTILNIPDFRASERTFQLLMQVAGRSGRHELPGEVIFQTYNPEHYAITHATNHDYTGFYRKEAEFRKFARYSPFYHHVLFTVSSERVEECLKGTALIHKKLSDNMSEKAIIIGPAPSPIERINKQYRFQILLKYKREPVLNDILHELDEEFFELYNKKKASLRIDMHPQMMM